MKPITENIIEESAIEILQSQEWEYVNENGIKGNTKQIHILTQLPDMLLPKLISGKVRVNY